MREITLEELLEAGCHFGHQVTRQNPKAREFIFEARDNIHIIDLVKTKEQLEEAGNFVRDLAKREGTSMVVVGTKRQAQGIVVEEIQRAKEKSIAGLFSVTNRWIGGTLTNFSEVAKNYKKLKELTQKLQNEEEKEKYTKKEVRLWEKERQKLSLLYSGVADMDKMPNALFVVDTHLEDLAVKEAIIMDVPTVGIVDTNADPTIIDYPIAANDDAVGSLKLIVSYIIDAWIEGAESAKQTSSPASEADRRGQDMKKDSETKREEQTQDQIKKTEKRKAKKAIAEKPEGKSVRKTKTENIP